MTQIIKNNQITDKNYLLALTNFEKKDFKLAKSNLLKYLNNNQDYRALNLLGICYLNLKEYLDENTHARIKLDVGISYEEANFIRETFAKQFNVRELQLIPIKEEEEAFEGTEVQFESVDQIVISQLETIDSQIVDKEKLIELYREIIV